MSDKDESQNGVYVKIAELTGRTKRLEERMDKLDDTVTSIKRDVTTSAVHQEASRIKMETVSEDVKGMKRVLMWALVGLGGLVGVDRLLEKLLN